ncbi:MFS transporter [Streptomyces halstedii]|uniref:MFS transporter n=1 Tax=Streptomyces halstedii TaxID=1944 RepID=UPI0037960B83
MRVREVAGDRTAVLCLTGVLVSGFGTSAMWLTAGIWVKSLTGSNSLAALTVFALWAPVLAGPALGSLADRLPRRPLLVGVNLLLAGLLAALPLTGPALRVPALFAVLLVYGAGGVVLDAAEAAVVAGAVEDRLLGDFNGLRTTVNEGVKLVAPAAGAGLFARFGAGPAVVLDALSFALAALVFARLRVAEPAPAPSRRGGTAAGLRGLRGSPTLRPLVYAGALTMLLAGLNGAAVYAVVDEVLARSPAYAGVLYAAQGAGSVLAGTTAGPLLRRLGERRFAAAGIAVFAAAVGVRALSGGSGAAAVGASVAIGAGLPCVLIAALTAVQRETPDRVLGRTVAAAHTLLMAPNAVALAVGAGLLTAVDVRPLLGSAAVAGLLVAARLNGRWWNRKAGRWWRKAGRAPARPSGSL